MGRVFPVVGVPLQGREVIGKSGGLLHLMNPLQGLRNHRVFKPGRSHRLPPGSLCSSSMLTCPTESPPPMVNELLGGSHRDDFSAPATKQLQKLLLFYQSFFLQIVGVNCFVNICGLLRFDSQLGYLPAH